MRLDQMAGGMGKGGPRDRAGLACRQSGLAAMRTHLRSAATGVYTPLGAGALRLDKPRLTWRARNPTPACAAALGLPLLRPAGARDGIPDRGGARAARPRAIRGVCLFPRTRG